jgi:N-acetylglucosaminyldiphosphoundecaprenol N-acetyl-beta-D-mannosaminyltransferase
MPQQSSIPRADVLGVGISAVNMSSAIRAVSQAVDRPGFVGYVTVTGVHGVMESQDDDALKNIHLGSFLSIPDGIPMVWVGRWQGYDHMQQVCGPEFMPALMAHGIEKNRRHFLWGGGDGVVDILELKLQERHAGLRIVGKGTPPFRPLTEEEERQLLDQILESQPHYFWVGLSTPKQERFMADFIAKYEDRLASMKQGILFFGVGAAFDFQAGIVSECPHWLRGSGFEWLYRLFTNPKRLAKRYFKNNPRFVWRALRQHRRDPSPCISSQSKLKN